MKNNVVTRFAPSPTGRLHIGSYRTAIFSYLYARKHNGKFILRIEDTDKDRSKKEFEDNILESLAWLDLPYDEKYTQSENLERHHEILSKMIKEGSAYVSKEEAKDGSGVIKEIVRFKNPNKDVTFVDAIKGSVTMNTSDLGDFVIAKNINEPLFHLAVVVDDFDEGVTHIIRGEDHVSNTPRQILIQEAIGAKTPTYAHIPLVLGPDKQKLSKRRGALAISEYKDLGYLPEAILNMVSMIGWNPGTEQEIFTKEELIEQFDFDKVQKSPAIFNEEKLNWINKEYLKKMDDKTFLELSEEYLPEKFKSISEKVLPILRERIERFSDVRKIAEDGDLDYLLEEPKPSKDLLRNTEFLSGVFGLLNNIDSDKFTKENIKDAIWDFATEKGRGEVLWPMRVALTGKEKSPDPFLVAEILGKNETIKRIDAASKI